MTDFADLIARLEAATGPDRALDAEIARDVCGLVIHEWPDWIARTSAMHDFPALWPTPFYTESVDAAMTLIPDGFWWTVGAGRTRPDEPLYGAFIYDGDDLVGSGETEVSAAIALCVAALKARGERGL